MATMPPLRPLSHDLPLGLRSVPDPTATPLTSFMPSLGGTHGQDHLYLSGELS
jgi:hypothetical protein